MDTHEPTEPTELIQPPTDKPRRSLTPLLVGSVALAVVSLSAAGLHIAQTSNSTPADGAGDSLPVVTSTATTAAAVTITSTSAAVAVASAAVPTETTTAEAAPGTNAPATPAVTTTPPPQVDSCSYANMQPTVVSGTTYTPRPTPTVTVVTAPDTCPPYSAGYPWDSQ